MKQRRGNLTLVLLLTTLLLGSALSISPRNLNSIDRLPQHAISPPSRKRDVSIKKRIGAFAVGIGGSYVVSRGCVPSTPRVGAGLLAGLLASNCCILQLLLGTFFGGCMGFKALARFKLLAMVSLGAVLYDSWHHSSPSNMYLRVGMTTMLLTVAFSEDVLEQVVNRYDRADSSKLLGDEKVFTHDLLIGGMGCQACRSKVSAVLRDLPWVISAKVDMDGKAQVKVSGRKDFNALKCIEDAIEGAGYSSSIQSPS